MCAGGSIRFEGPADDPARAIMNYRQAGDGLLSRAGGRSFAHPPFDARIERVRGVSGRAQMELSHEADRMALTDRVAMISLFQGQSLAFSKRRVEDRWEFGKSCPSFADLVVTSGASVEPESKRASFTRSPRVDTAVG